MISLSSFMDLVRILVEASAAWENGEKRLSRSLIKNLIQKLNQLLVKPEL